MYISKEQVKVKRDLMKHLFPEFKFSVTNDKHNGLNFKAIEVPNKVHYTDYLIKMYGESYRNRVGAEVQHRVSVAFTDLVDHRYFNLILFVINYSENRHNHKYLECDFDSLLNYGTQGFEVGDKNGVINVVDRAIPKKLSGSPEIKLFSNNFFKATRGEWEVYVKDGLIIDSVEGKKLELLEKLTTF